MDVLDYHGQTNQLYNYLKINQSYQINLYLDTVFAQFWQSWTSKGSYTLLCRTSQVGR